MRITKHDIRHLGAGRPGYIVRKNRTLVTALRRRSLFLRTAFLADLVRGLTGGLIDQEIVSLATGLDLAEDSRWSMSTFRNLGKPKSLPA